VPSISKLPRITSIWHYLLPNCHAKTLNWKTHTPTAPLRVPIEFQRNTSDEMGNRIPHQPFIQTCALKYELNILSTGPHQCTLQIPSGNLGCINQNKWIIKWRVVVWLVTEKHGNNCCLWKSLLFVATITIYGWKKVIQTNYLQILDPLLIEEGCKY